MNSSIRGITKQCFSLFLSSSRLLCKNQQIKIVKKRKRKRWALAGVAQWIDRQPANQGVTSSIPGQGTCRGHGPCLRFGVCKSQPTDVFLPLFLPPSPSLGLRGGGGERVSGREVAYLGSWVSNFSVAVCGGRSERGREREQDIQLRDYCREAWTRLWRGEERSRWTGDSGDETNQELSWGWGGKEPGQGGSSSVQEAVLSDLGAARGGAAGV